MDFEIRAANPGISAELCSHSWSRWDSARGGTSPGRALSAGVFKPNAAPGMKREGDSSAAWGTIPSTF